MNEILIIDYLKDNNLHTYSEFFVESVRIASDMVVFNEHSFESDCTNTVRHTIPLLDILAWVYIQIP